MKEIAAGDDPWWESLSKEQQKKYIEEHPNSKYAQQVRTGKIGNVEHMESPLPTSDTKENSELTELKKKASRALAKHDKLSKEISRIKNQIGRYKKDAEAGDSDAKDMYKGLSARLLYLEKEMDWVLKNEVNPSKLALKDYSEN